MEAKKENKNYLIVKKILEQNKNARENYTELYYEYYSLFFNIKNRSFYEAMQIIELNKEPKDILIFGQKFEQVKPASIQTLARIRRLVQSMFPNLRPSKYDRDEEESVVRKEIKELEKEMRNIIN